MNNYRNIVDMNCKPKEILWRYIFASTDHGSTITPSRDVSHMTL